MKKLFLLFMLPVSILMFSCNGEKEPTDEGNANKDSSANSEEYKDMREYDFSEHGLPLKMMIPNIQGEEGVLDPEVIHEDDSFTWEIILSTTSKRKDFHIVVDDYGKDDSFSAANFKKNTAETDQIFTYEFLKDEDNYLLYNKKLPEDAGEGVKPLYHIYASPTINEVNYVIKSYDMGEFYMPDAEKMMLSAKSAKSTQAS